MASAVLIAKPVNASESDLFFRKLCDALKSAVEPAPVPGKDGSTASRQIIAVGASTGGTKALEVIQKELDVTMALCGERNVNHLGRHNLLIPKDFLDSYA